MSLQDQVGEVFAVGGVLHSKVAGFKARPGQAAMALAVAEIMAQGGQLVVEAGTGVGKTFAYLVPALLSGERVLLSTATKTLQEQLYSRDLPGLLRVLGSPVRIAMLKGRASYLCAHRLGLARQDAQLSAPALQRVLAQVEHWSQATRTGDLAELPDLDERSALLSAVTSTRENCLGAQCPKLQNCHVNQARRAALAADVVVINHHLFFADMTVRESGMAELLPSVRVVVFDEAHRLNDVGIQFLGMTLSTGQLLALCRDALTAGLRLARGLVDWQGLAGELERVTRDFQRALGETPVGGARGWDKEAPHSVLPEVWHAAMTQLGYALRALQQAMDSVSEIAPDFGRLHERVAELLTRVGRFAVACPSDAVRWLDVENSVGGGSAGSVTDAGAGSGVSRPHRRVRLVESPLDIAEAFKAQRMQSAAASEHERSWIFTSATLGHDDRLTWFTQSCGLTDAQVLRVDSPFDYRAQAALYVPAGFPLPAEPAHSAHVSALAAQSAEQLGGRTLVLTTTLKAMRAIGMSLASYFELSGKLEVLVQGQWPKRQLMARFREGKGCILVASASFWEGFDVPGDALQLVIIDKLPFPPPYHPLVEARSNRVVARGQNPFSDYFVPEATVALKQGAGRLIRQETDQGVLVVCDPRLSTKGYGKRMLAALPPLRRLGSEQEFVTALALLATRTSTTGCPQISHPGPGTGF